MSREQVQEAADHLLSETGAALRCLVFTMLEWDLPTTASAPTPLPPLDTLVPLSLQPPPSLTDDPGNGTPPPPPPHQSPEPGTLIAALAGAGAIVYRYRRRRAKAVGRDEKAEVSEKEIELAM